MRTLAAALAAALLLAAPTPAAAALPGDDLPFASAVFRATHNSYSGNVDGAKGSITYQLDNGVRFLEFDIHDNGYASTLDYAVGHDAPGDKVDHTGNPSTNNLRAWLQTVAAWSAGHPDHAPLLVMLDLKDDLTDNTSYAAGNLAAVNQELSDAFGAQLLLAKDVPGTLGTIGSLRGRVLTLLSGDAGTRSAYKADTGANPAVAINARGQVVEVHDSGSGTLWYWSGAYGADGRVTWLRHGRYDSGTTPAIALNDNGYLVEVHKSQSASTLWYHVGQITADGDIAWSASHQYDSGVLPSIAFVGPGSTAVREIHRSQSNSQNWFWDGTLNASAGTVTWNTGTHAKTSDARYATTSSASSVGRVTVSVGSDGYLRAATDRVGATRISYQQIAFDEYQAGDSALLQEGALFYAAVATNKSFITSSRAAGKIVRGWDFDDASLATTPIENYPATNNPWSSWYSTLLAANSAVQ
ncbi:PI-PLC domain-containing protein [Hamadaea tsunoensis]|uniref:Ca2+-dependent phosphoinositide-specific phospholipase C n=1 Tax=Hamadaea tsunoensis TaxID=53368 RepID=UPI000424483F|nr:Ca2+-dependent phosphoinositide-specific phospholipase C [Hamadaea tsunoensis]